MEIAQTLLCLRVGWGRLWDKPWASQAGLHWFMHSVPHLCARECGQFWCLHMVLFAQTRKLAWPTFLVWGCIPKWRPLEGQVGNWASVTAGLFSGERLQLHSSEHCFFLLYALQPLIRWSTYTRTWLRAHEQSCWFAVLKVRYLFKCFAFHFHQRISLSHRDFQVT